MSLALQPGEWAKVKTIEEITATLDAEGRFAGLSFMPVVMSRFCGRTFPVKKRIDNFFDERRWRMLKSRDVVILDGVFCEPPLEAAADWARCDRTCFLFWSEAWLERASAPRSGERL